jgi:hypothetical protein
MNPRCNGSGATPQFHIIYVSVNTITPPALPHA